MEDQCAECFCFGWSNIYFRKANHEKFEVLLNWMQRKQTGGSMGVE